MRRLFRRIVRPLIEEMKASEPECTSRSTVDATITGDYQARVASELLAFDNCVNVHELPPIFHYWSNRDLAPAKFNPFGITAPVVFFFFYTKRFHDAHPGRVPRLVSVGSGNCDMEARLARRLLDSGVQAFWDRLPRYQRDDAGAGQGACR